MKTTFIFRVLGVLLLVVTAFSSIAPTSVSAQDAVPSVFTFADMGMREPITLTSPAGEYELKFNLPVEWVAQGKVLLDLNLSAFFSSLVASEETTPITGLVGGDLSVIVNGINLGTNSLSQAGEQTLQIEFDSTLLTAPARGSVNQVVLRWDSSAACLMNLVSTISIFPTSTMSFSYSANAEDLTLNRFPVPFVIEDPLVPVGLKILVPDEPSVAEMRAAMILAAGIGKISEGKTEVEVVSLGQHMLDSRAHPNLIIVGASEQLNSEAYRLLELPKVLSVKAGEGSIQLFKQSFGTYSLVVSGDEEGLINAAQVVSANQIIAPNDENQMVVASVNPANPVSGIEDQTLQDLGIGELVFNYSDGISKAFDFYVPAGSQARADSYLSLVISHSQQLDYLRSGLQVKLNGYPAASLRLTDTTSNENVFQLILASNLVHSGRNTIELIADLYTRDLCTEPVSTIAWLRVSSSSLLHLPLESSVTDASNVKSFGDFPDQFLSGSALNNVAFIIPAAEPAAWSAAGNLAWKLGTALPASEPLQLQVSWADSVDPALMASSSLLYVGKPSDFPTLSQEGQFPALVFNVEDLLSDASMLDIVTQPMAGANVGYLAIRGYTDGSNRILMAVLGNNERGIALAAEGVVSEAVKNNNFAMVMDEGVQSGWMDQNVASGKITTPDTAATEIPTGTDTIREFKSGMLAWVVPAIVVLLLVFGFLIIAEIKHLKK